MRDVNILKSSCRRWRHVVGIVKDEPKPLYDEQRENAIRKTKVKQDDLGARVSRMKKREAMMMAVKRCTDRDGDEKSAGCEKRIKTCSFESIGLEDRSEYVQMSRAWIGHGRGGKSVEYYWVNVALEKVIVPWARHGLQSWKQRKCTDPWSVSVPRVQEVSLERWRWERIHNSEWTTVRINVARTREQDESLHA